MEPGGRRGDGLTTVAGYELFRAYDGAPPAKARDGREVGATRELLRSLAALARNNGSTHVGVTPA